MPILRGHIRLRGLEIATHAVVVAVLLIGLVTLAPVWALSPPAPSSLIPIAEYGMTTVYASQGKTSIGVITIKVTSDGYGPFFVVKLLIYMNTPAQSNLILANMAIDGLWTITFSQYAQLGVPTVVIIPSGSTIGEVVSSLPNYLASLEVVKDPFGNPAIVLSGGPGNGLTVGVQFSQQQLGGAPLFAEAIVTAPSNNTISMSFS